MSEDLVGAVVDEVGFDVERGKIGEFVRATRTQDAVHTDPHVARSAGFDDVLATATHVVVVGHHRDQAAFVASLGLALERVVVGSVTWEYARPLLAGATLTGVRRVIADERREGRRGGTMRVLTLETDFVDQAGELCVRQRDVLIERSTGA